MEIVQVARNPTIADLVDDCAAGKLPFSGPNSLCSKVASMGFNGNGLYAAVQARKAELTAKAHAMNAPTSRPVPEERRLAAAALWARYCRRFGLRPEQIEGCRYPGFEDVETNKAMVAEVQALLDR